MCYSYVSYYRPRAHTNKSKNIAIFADFMLPNSGFVLHKALLP